MFQQEIVAFIDATFCKFNEDTPWEEVIKGVLAAMKISIKDSTKKLSKKLSKIVVVANPILGQDWLEEVTINSYRLLSLNFEMYFIQVSKLLSNELAYIERHWNLYVVLELSLDKYESQLQC